MLFYFNINVTENTPYRLFEYSYPLIELIKLNVNIFFAFQSTGLTEMDSQLFGGGSDPYIKVTSEPHQVTGLVARMGDTNVVDAR